MFCDCIINLGLNQLITEPTHGKNILDLLFTNNPVTCKFTSVSPFLTSDHNSVHFSIWTPLCETQNKPVTRIICKANFNVLQAEFRRVAWDDMFTDMSADKMWIKDKNILSNAVEKYVPLSKQNIKNNRYPNYIVAALLRKKQLWREKNSPGGPQAYKDYAKVQSHHYKISPALRNESY